MSHSHMQIIAVLFPAQGPQDFNLVHSVVGTLFEALSAGEGYTSRYPGERWGQEPGRRQSGSVDETLLVLFNFTTLWGLKTFSPKISKVPLPVIWISNITFDFSLHFNPFRCLFLYLKGQARANIKAKYCIFINLKWEVRDMKRSESYSQCKDIPTYLNESEDLTE